MIIYMKLKEKLHELKAKEAQYTARQVELEIKKGVIEFCQKEGYSRSKTLETLNAVLTEDNRQPVTIGCVNHHWK